MKLLLLPQFFRAFSDQRVTSERRHMQYRVDATVGYQELWAVPGRQLSGFDRFALPGLTGVLSARGLTWSPNELAPFCAIFGCARFGDRHFTHLQDSSDVTSSVASFGNWRPRASQVHSKLNALGCSLKENTVQT